MTQRGELVARASTLFLRRSAQPAVFLDDGHFMPPVPAEPAQFDDSAPLFIKPFGRDMGDGDNPWQ